MSGRLPEEPVRLPVNQQSWRHLSFLHYRYAVADVQQLVPDGLRVQSWGGSTWVGITPFRMEDVRLPALPPPPGWGAFAELNVRAYVEGPDGGDGLFFLGMMVPRPGFALALRSIGLPYVTAGGQLDVDGRRWSYRFGRPGWRGLGRHVGDPPWFSTKVTVGPALAPDERTAEVDAVTGRWAAYHRRARVLLRTPVRHEVWPLHHASVEGDPSAPLRWVGLPPPSEPPMVHAAPGVHASVGPPRPLRLLSRDG